MSAPLRAIGSAPDPAQAWAMDPRSATPGQAGPAGASSAVITGATSAGVQPGTVLTRTLYVNITGSLAALEMSGPSAGTWKLVDGKCLGVFGMGAEVDAQVCFRTRTPFRDVRVC